MSEKAKKNPLKGIANYFKEVRAELKKVVWPTFKQIKNNTIIVVISLILVGIIIFVFDLGFKTTLEAVVNRPSESEQIENLPIDESTLPLEEEGTEQPDQSAEQEQPEQATEQNNE